MLFHICYLTPFDCNANPPNRRRLAVNQMPGCLTSKYSFAFRAVIRAQFHYRGA
jgi:hypothetical protein